MEYIVNELDRIQNGIITSLYPAYLSLLDYIDNTLRETNNRLSEGITLSLDSKLADFLAKIDRTFIGIDRILNYSAGSYQEGKNVGNREFTINDLPEDKFTTLESLVGLKDTMVKNLISKISVGLGLDYSNYNLPLLTTLKNLRNYARCTIVSYNQALFYEKERDLTIYPSTVGRDTELVYTKTSVDDSSSIITAVDRDKQNLHIATLKDGQIKLNWNKYIRSDDVSDFIYNTEIHLADFGMLNTTVSVAHNISKDHISLGSVENLPIVSREEVLAHVNATKYLTFDNLLVFMNNLFADKAEAFKPKFPAKTEYLIDNCVVVFSPPGFGSDERCDFPDGNVLTRKTTKPTTTVTPIPTKPIPPLGTLIGRVCDTYTLIGIYSDGWGGSYTEIIAPNSAECGYTPPPTHLPKDTELARNCNGTILVGTYADGEGGTYDKMLEVNSVTCGYVPPLTNIPKGTQIGYTCDGENKLGVYADGGGGTYQALLEVKSPECGFAPDPRGIIIQAGVCNYESHYKYNIITDGMGGTEEEIIENNSVACGYVTPDPYGPYGTLVTKDYCIPGTTSMCDIRADGHGGTYQDNIRTLVPACGYVPPTTLDPTININTLVTEVTEKVNTTVRITGSVARLVATKNYSVKWFLQNITDSDFVEQTTTYLNSDKSGTFVDLIINPTSTGTVSLKARLVNTADTSEFFVSNVISLASKVAQAGPVPTISVTSSKNTVYSNTSTTIRLTAAVDTKSSTKTYGVEWFIQNLNTTTYTSIGFSNLSTDKTSSTFDTTVNPTTTGFLMFQARLVNNASAADYVTSTPVTVTVENKPDIGVPTINFTVTPNDVVLGANDLLTLTAAIGNLDISYTYDIKWLVTQPGQGSDTQIAPFGDQVDGTPTANKTLSPRTNTYFTTTGNARFGISVTRRNSIPAVTATGYANIKINPPPTKLQILDLSTSSALAIQIVNGIVATGNGLTFRIDCTDFPVSTNNIIKMYRNGVFLEDVTIPTDANGRGGKSPIVYQIVPADTANFPNGSLIYEARYPLNPGIKSSITFTVSRDIRTPRLVVTNKLSSNSINIATTIVPNGPSTTTITPPRVRFDVELREFDPIKTYSILINRNSTTGPYETSVTVTTDGNGNYIPQSPIERDVPSNATAGQLLYVASVNNITGSVDYIVTTSSKTKSLSMTNMNATNSLNIMDNVISPNTVKIKVEVFNLTPSSTYSVPINVGNNNVGTYSITTDASGNGSVTPDIPVTATMSNSNVYVFSTTVDNLPGSVTYNITRSTSNFTFTSPTSRTINVVNNVSDVTQVLFSIDLVALPSKTYIVKLFGNSNFMMSVNMNTDANGIASVPKTFPIDGAAIANGPLEIKADLYKLDGVTFDRSIPIQFNVIKTTKTPVFTMTIENGYSNTANLIGDSPTSPYFTTVKLTVTDFNPSTTYRVSINKSSTVLTSSSIDTNASGAGTVGLRLYFNDSLSGASIPIIAGEQSVNLIGTITHNNVQLTSSLIINVNRTTAAPSVTKTFTVRKTDNVSTINIDTNNTVSPSQVGLEFTGTGWPASSYIINVTDSAGRTYASVNAYTVNGSFTTTPMNFTIPSNTNSGGFDLRGSLDGMMALASYTIVKATAAAKTFTMVKSPAINGIEMLANGTGNPSSFGVTFSISGYTPYSSVFIVVGRRGPNANDVTSNYDAFNINTLSDGTGTVTKTYYPDASWGAGTLEIMGSTTNVTAWEKSVSFQVTKITVAPTIVITALATTYTLNPSTGNHSTPAYLTITINNAPPEGSGHLINFYKNNAAAGPNGSGVQFYRGSIYPLNPDGVSANYTDTLFDKQFGGTSVVTYTANFVYRGITYSSSPFTVYVNETGGSTIITTSAPVYRPPFTISADTTTVTITTDANGNIVSTNPSIVTLRVAVANAPTSALINSDFFRDDINGTLGAGSAVSSVFGACTITYPTPVLLSGKPTRGTSSLVYRFKSLTEFQPNSPADSVIVNLVWNNSTTPTTTPTTTPASVLRLEIYFGRNISDFSAAYKVYTGDTVNRPLTMNNLIVGRVYKLTLGGNYGIFNSVQTNNLPLDYQFTANSTTMVFNLIYRFSFSTTQARDFILGNHTATLYEVGSVNPAVDSQTLKFYGNP
jgi:hypothetical protein